jgi:DNA-binding response OmpR family regulator
MNILIIEDDKLTLNLLQYSVEQLGHKTFLSEDGEDAIKLINEKEFDLIICDIMMPGISGLSLVSVLRTIHLSTVPIIMMSSLNNKPLLEAAFEAGANDFIAKPFSMEELSAKLNKYDSTLKHG